MASPFMDNNDLERDARKPTLYSVTDEKNKALSKKTQLHRLVSISSFGSIVRDPGHIGGHFKKLLKELQNACHTEPITGLLLLYHRHMIHIVESSSDMIQQLVLHLLHCEKAPNGILSKSKILVISHDIPERLYSQWCYRSLDIEAHDLNQFSTCEETYKVVEDVLIQLLKLSFYLYKQAMSNLKKALDTLYESVPEFLPQQSVIHYLLTEDDGSMILPEELITMYRTPFDYTLSTEFTWPMDVTTLAYTYHN